MSNVVQFPTSSNADAHHIVIEAGTIMGPPGHPNLGQLRYFVSVVDTDDDMVGVWEGSTHEEALDEARLWDLPVVDITIAGSSTGGAA